MFSPVHRLVGGVPSLWVRKPQLGTGPNLEDDTLMQMNLKAAMYTRMFAGDLGPGQIIDPEMPSKFACMSGVCLFVCLCVCLFLYFVSVLIDYFHSYIHAFRNLMIALKKLSLIKNCMSFRGR